MGGVSIDLGAGCGFGAIALWPVCSIQPGGKAAKRYDGGADLEPLGVLLSAETTQIHTAHLVVLDHHGDLQGCSIVITLNSLLDAAG